MKMQRALPRNAGISLIELVVAMAVFALIAIMGLQSLTGTVRISERLTEIDAETAEIGNALALLRNDLSAIVPLLFYPPGAAPEAAVDWDTSSSTLGLSLAGGQRLDPSHTDRSRAIWQVDPDTNTLIRRFWPSLLPTDAAQLGNSLPVLQGVTDLRLRTFWAEAGWVDGHRAPTSTAPIIAAVEVDQDGAGIAPPVYYSAVPMAVEVTVQSDRFGALRLVETLR